MTVAAAPVAEAVAVVAVKVAAAPEAVTVKKKTPAMTERNGDKMSSPSVLRISLKMCSVLECELGRGLGTGGHGSPAKGAEGGGKTAKTKNSHMHNPAQG